MNLLFFMADLITLQNDHILHRECFIQVLTCCILQVCLDSSSSNWDMLMVGHKTTRGLCKCAGQGRQPLPFVTYLHKVIFIPGASVSEGLNLLAEHNDSRGRNKSTALSSSPANADLLFSLYGGNVCQCG